MIKIKKTIKAAGIISLGILLLSLPVTAQKSPSLTDPEVAHVAVTANQIDIDYAAIAKAKSTNKAIVEFAETMARDHKAIIGQAVALVTKLGVTPKDNAVSKKFLNDAEKTKKMLQSESKKTFDKAYIDNEVTYHKAVIAAVEGLLIPQSKNKELKSLLENVVPALKAHLAHAEMVQKEISKK